MQDRRKFSEEEKSEDVEAVVDSYNKTIQRIVVKLPSLFMHNIISMHFMVLSGCSGFLRMSKIMHVRLIGD